MRKAELMVLLDYGYWATRRVLAAAAALPPAQFTASAHVTTRSLRATLVHALDVEWNRRLRLQGQPTAPAGPDRELREEDFPTATVLADRWRQDEREMRAWLDGLSDEQLASTPGVVEAGKPLWQYVLHVIAHGFQQRADAATLLSRHGRSPGELDFLGYVNSLEPGHRSLGVVGQTDVRTTRTPTLGAQTARCRSRTAQGLAQVDPYHASQRTRSRRPGPLPPDR